MSYIGNEPIVSATRTTTEIVATANQTVFTANGGYTPGYLDVYVNGAQMQSSDFTATNGSSVTLAQACFAGDDIKLVAWGVFNATNVTGSSIIDGTITQAKFSTNVAGNGAAFSAYQSSGQSLSAGTNTKITFTTEVFDTGNCFASSRFTPTVAGYYQFNCAVRSDAGTVNALHVKLSKNGSVEFAAGSFTNSALGAFESSCSGLTYLNGTTDFVEVYAYSGTTMTLSTGTSATYFQGFMARAA